MVLKPSSAHKRQNGLIARRPGEERRETNGHSSPSTLSSSRSRPPSSHSSLHRISASSPSRSVPGRCDMLVTVMKDFKLKVYVYILFIGTIWLILITNSFLLFHSYPTGEKFNDIVKAVFLETLSSQCKTTTVRSSGLGGNDDPIGSNQHTDDNLLLDEGDPSMGGHNGAHKGIFFSNISYDYRDCTSPESTVPWPLEGYVYSKTSSMSCGMRSATPFSLFFRGTLWKKKIKPLTQDCNRMVVFGVAFGGEFVQDLDAPHVRQLVNATDLLQRHGRCFFIFTSEEEFKNASLNGTAQQNSRQDRYGNHTHSDDYTDPIMIGHNILIPIPSSILPYRNPRRNVKLLKYMGQFMFRQAEVVIWQDAKFFREDFVSKQPVDYGDLIEKDACVTAMGLPVHKGTVGLENIRRGILSRGRYTPRYEHHCQAIIDALIDRPNVTDSAENLIRQCDAYLQHVYLQEGNTDAMNQGLIDSAFIIWNQKTPACRDFNSALRCTIMDQIQCHSDRDQVSIPFALYTMGLSATYRRQPTDVKKSPIDRDWDSRIHDLDFIRAPTEKRTIKDQLYHSSSPDDVMVRVVRSSCHWYFSRLGNCRTGLEKGTPYLAILVAGTAKRFAFQGLVDHVIKPLVQEQQTMVDYYIMLSVKQGLAYRADEAYMRLQTYDPAFSSMKDEKDAEVVTLYMYDKIRDAITFSGANLGGIHIQHQPMKLDPPKLRKKQLEAKKARPKEDSYYRFPTLDLRPEFRRRTAVYNRNIFKMYLGLQKLWDKHLITSEHYIGVSYDYVMILRDDVMWLDDFNMETLIDTNPYADAYIPSCDMSYPPKKPREYNDYAIVIKREMAAVIGKYFTKLLDPDIEACHASVKEIAEPDTGCNSGMLLYYILNKHNVTVQEVSQSLFPFERTMTLNLKTGETVTCIHKFCQSSTDPLVIPSGLQMCKNITVTPLPGVLHELVLEKRDNETRHASM
jgi:hypothetical protein